MGASAAGRDSVFVAPHSDFSGFLVVRKSLVETVGYSGFRGLTRASARVRSQFEIGSLQYSIMALKLNNWVRLTFRQVGLGRWPTAFQCTKRVTCRDLPIGLPGLMPSPGLRAPFSPDRKPVNGIEEGKSR